MIDYKNIKPKDPQVMRDSSNNLVKTFHNKRSAVFSKQKDIMPVYEPSEISEAMKEMNTDVIDTETGMSTMDMKARLHPIEATSVLALDALVHLNFLPPSCLGLTRQKKRLSVSINGEGRKENVQIVEGKRSTEERTGIIGRMGKGIKSMFTGGSMQ